MEKKGFVMGLVIASCVWISTIVLIRHMENNPIIIENCDLSEDDVIDTEFEQLMIDNRVKAYERGYYVCLQDTRPDIHKAYIACVIQLRNVVGDPAFEKIVDAECARNNLNAEDKEYLCNLLLD